MSVLGVGLVLLLQAQAASVEGVVTKPGGGEPLAGARVSLIRANSGKPDPVEALPPGPVNGIEASSSPLSTTSEDDGRFTLRNVPPGDYTLSVESRRYGSAVYGQRVPGSPGSTVSLRAGERLADIRISMVPTGAIAGRITGRNGEPVVRALVQASQYAYRDGKRLLVPRQSATANDLGEYRIFSLPAGQYVVAATLEDNRGYGAAIRMEALRLLVAAVGGNGKSNDQGLEMIQEFFAGGQIVNRVLDDGTVQEEAWMPTYYPGTILSAQAAPINVSAGATMNGINISISASPVRKISGLLVGPPGMSPTLTLMPPTSSVGLRPLAMNLESRGGSFEFKGISPGSYTLIARDQRSGFASAPLQIDVGDRDIENLTIGLIPGITLMGRVIVESSVADSGGVNALAGITIGLLNQRQWGETFTTTVPIQERTGSFVLANLSPGDYQVDLQQDASRPPEAKRLFVKSARLGLTDVTDGIPITGDTRDRLEVVLANETGSVEGTVEDSRRMPVTATVVLIPAVAPRISSRYNATVADSAGRFRFAGIIPGDYLLFAWDVVEPGAWQNPDFMRPFESRGRPVRVVGAGKEDVQITVISNP